jgi:hypothetical protein
LKFIHFASQLCGIQPYGSLLANDGYEKPVVSRKCLLHTLILLIAISVVQLLFVIRLVREITGEISDAYRFSVLIMLILLLCIFTTYSVTAITHLTGVRNFFKTSRKLLSVGLFMNYHEGTAFSKAVIALHFVLFITYLFIHSIEWIRYNCPLYFLPFHISCLICDTVISFSAIQFLYFVLTLRRHFLLFNSSLNEFVMSTVKSEDIPSLKVRAVSYFVPECYCVISGLREFLNCHLLLCDILEVINSSYSVQVLAFMGSKYVYATACLYILFFTVFDLSKVLVLPFPVLICVISYEVMQLLSVVYCCRSASVQVGTITEYYIRQHCGRRSLNLAFFGGGFFNCNGILRFGFRKI